MAFIPVSGYSQLDAIVDRIRRIKMTDWIKMLGSAAVAVAVAWSMLQQHDYRLGKLEDSLETHLQKHDDQNTQIQKTLTQIQIDLSKLTK